MEKFDRFVPALALVGCGAIAESFYIPVLARHYPSILRGAILVDAEISRAQDLARKYDVRGYTANYLEIANEVRGVILALPPHLHSRVALDFIKQGVPVLCEKPLAPSFPEALRMVEAAERGEVPLLVNNTRRLYPSYIAVNKLVRSHAIGAIKSIDYSEGGEFQWPTASGFYFNAGLSGARGVLLDRGSHVLDLLCWWLGENPHLVSYLDDSLGGCEASAEVNFRMGDCRGTVRLSWLGKLQNQYTLVGERGKIGGNVFDWNRLYLWTEGSDQPKVVWGKQGIAVYRDFARLLISNFLAVIERRAEPLVPAREVLPSIHWIDECYASRQTFQMPWMRYRLAVNENE